MLKLKELPNNEKARRWALFLLSLFFSGIGVAFMRHSGLGASPISAVSSVITEAFPFFSFGVWLFFWNLILLVAQIIILRKEFSKIYLLQIPLSFLFGLFTDLGTVISDRFPVDSYTVQMVSLFIGIFVHGFGVTLAVKANVMFNSGEALVKAINHKTGFSFGLLKIAVDCGYVVIAVILSLRFFDMQLVGIREGTILAAIFTGLVVKVLGDAIGDELDKWFKPE